MVDLAVAANFVRELTQEQFAEPQRTPRRGAAANSAEKGPAPREARARKSTGVRRTLGRLAQVRG